MEFRIEGFIYGSPVYLNEETDTWHYTDGEPVPDDHSKYRHCPKCHKPPTPEGHDACLGTIPGVAFACCGHGVETGYITWENNQHPAIAEFEVELPRWMFWLLRLTGRASFITDKRIKPFQVGIRYYYNTAELDSALGYAQSR